MHMVSPKTSSLHMSFPLIIIPTKLRLLAYHDCVSPLRVPSETFLKHATVFTLSDCTPLDTRL
jgi:hypothetical protein